MPKTHPKVSVILPTFNRERELPAALSSVLEQDFTDLELIVVDDASTDGTAGLSSLGADPRIRFIRLENRSGGAAARNRGLEQAQGEWIAFQDSDDRWHPTKLSRQIAALQQARAVDPGYEAIFCRYRRELPGGRERTEPPERSVPQDGRLLPALFARSLIGTPTLVVRRELLRRLGGFDERMPRLQDWELAIRIAAEAKIAYVDEILVEAGHTPNRLTQGHDQALIDAETRVLDRHRDRMIATGPACIAYRCWHLAHLHFMRGNRETGRTLLREAQAHHPLFHRRALGWLGISPALYRIAYKLVRSRE